VTDPLTDAVVAYLKELVASFRGSGSPVYLTERTRWKMDSSGVARRQTFNEPSLGMYFHTHREQSSLYEPTCQAIADDSDFRVAIGAMVGDQSHLSRFDADTVLSIASSGMVKEDGTISLRKARVSGELAKLRVYLKATHRVETVIIPLPGLKCYKLPFAFEKGIEIDTLSETEIEACAASAALRPMSGDFPLLRPEECIGVRIKIKVPAEIMNLSDLEASQAERTRQLQEVSEKEHQFGHLTRWHLDQIVDDVLFVLRLARPEFVGTQGAVVISNNPHGGSRSWVGRPTRNFVMSSYDLDKATGRAIRSTWRVMKDQAGKKHHLPPICARRFTAALDRISLDDALIDHMIAAEALFLGDAGKPEEKGELGFRLSLRTAVFLERKASDQLALRKFMKTAYQARSGIAHGGSSKPSVKVPDRTPTVPLGEFVDELASVMRRAIIKAIGLYATDKNFGKPEFWDEVIIHD